MRKLTHEEFMEKLYKQNKHIEDIILMRTNAKVRNKIKCERRKKGHELKVRPKGEDRSTLRKTQEQFIIEVYEVNPNIEVLGHYKNNKTKIKFRCKKCDYEWETRPDNLLHGTGCPQCAGNARLISEEFMEKFYNQNKHAQDIEILGTYINSQTKIKCKCKIDGYEWLPRPNTLLNGNGCPKCAGTAKLTTEEFISRLHEVNPDIEVIGTYVNAKTKIKCRCRIDEYEWESIPRNLLHGHGCPKCAGKLIPTTEEFKEKLYQINPDIEIIGHYVMSLKKIQCKCKKCGHEWKATPNSLLQGAGCPKCKTTKGEKRIAQYLDNLNIHYIYNKKYFKDLVGAGGGLLRPDFIIPSLKIWIEFDGQQHFEPVNFTGAMSEQQLQELFEYTQQNDQIKDQYAKDNNWTLIRIPFTEYDNIEQILAEYIEQEQVI